MLIWWNNSKADRTVKIRIGVESAHKKARYFKYALIEILHEAN